MKILVWQWGRFGAGPRFAATLADAIGSLPETKVITSYSVYAEIMQGVEAPSCDIPVRTYRGKIGFAFRFLTNPLERAPLAGQIGLLGRPDFAVCAMPGPLDMRMAKALKRLNVPYALIVHDARPHVGDRLPFLHWLQRRLCERAAAIITLTSKVSRDLQADGVIRPIIQLSHPPLPFEVVREPHEGIHLLFFGRFRDYKGLDLLADALDLLYDFPGLRVRVVGSGPDLPALSRLRMIPFVEVDRRWVPEDEIGELLGWADAMIFPYIDATQSGMVGAASAGGLHVIATTVGGLREQLAGTKAILCEPNAAVLAAAIKMLPHLDRPEPFDVRIAWRGMARALITEMNAILHNE